MKISGSEDGRSGTEDVQASGGEPDGSSLDGVKHFGPAGAVDARTLQQRERLRERLGALLGCQGLDQTLGVFALEALDKLVLDGASPAGGEVNAASRAGIDIRVD